MAPYVEVARQSSWNYFCCAYRAFFHAQCFIQALYAEIAAGHNALVEVVPKHRHEIED